MNNFVNYLGATLLTVFISCDACAENLPSADSLFEKHVRVSYGENGLKDHPSMTVTTETLMKEYGVTVPAIEKHKAPGYRVSEGEAMGIRTAGGCKPSFCWEEGMRGPEIIEGNELRRWLEHADYYRWDNMNKYSKAMETQAETDWNGEAAYKVKVVDNFGKENFYYFSIDRGFLIGADLTIADLEGFTTRTYTYSDFKEFGPFTLPATTIENLPSLTRITKVVSVSFDDIPDSAFGVPDSIKQLMEKN